MPKYKEITGQRFGRLLVIDRAESSPRGLAQWRCRCDCGTEIITRGSSLRAGHTSSCGCWNVEQRERRKVTHGMAKTPTYTSWATMRARCSNPKNPQFKHYGARGIKVCARWRKFANFLADMGKRPNGASLDRINNEGNYCPENCRWASRRVQMNNTRQNFFITHAGETLSASQWSRRFGVKADTISARIRRGVPPDQAITAPPYTLPS